MARNPYTTVGIGGSGGEPTETPDMMFDSYADSGHRVAATKTHAAKVTPASVAALSHGSAVEHGAMYSTIAADGDGHDLDTHKARLVRNQLQEAARVAALAAADPHTVQMQVARASAEPEFRRISQYPRSAGAGTR